MVKESESQGNEEANFLIELLEKARTKHHACNSWEEFAAMVTLRSGDQVSGNTFRRTIRKGPTGWRSMSLSLPQWAAISEVTGVPMSELVRRFKNAEDRNNREES